jgi:fluoroquinolone resistance protein
LRRTDFAGSELSGAAFAGADLRDASLVGALGYALDVREVKVKGLRVDAAGAGGLLAPFGIVVG